MSSLPAMMTLLSKSSQNCALADSFFFGDGAAGKQQDGGSGPAHQHVFQAE